MTEFIWIHEDSAREVALIRGLRDKSLFEIAQIDSIVRWSTSGKGWVLPLEAVADLCAVLDFSGAHYRVKPVAA